MLVREKQTKSRWDKLINLDTDKSHLCGTCDSIGKKNALGTDIPTRVAFHTVAAVANVLEIVSRGRY